MVLPTLQVLGRPPQRYNEGCDRIALAEHTPLISVNQNRLTGTYCARKSNE